MARQCPTAATADCVHRLHTVMVHCSAAADATPTEPFRLGPIESLLPPVIPIAVVYVYAHAMDDPAQPQHPPGSPVCTVVDHVVLQQAMARLLSYYPQLAGRLSLQPDGERVIDRLDSGALFVEARCDKTLRELHEQRTAARSAGAESSGNSNGNGGGGGGQGSPVLTLFDLPDGANALFAPYSPSLNDVVRDPLMSLQHTRFACGGVSLGVRISHALCDAHGFFLVVGHLAELYRSIKAGTGAAVVTRPPQWRSYLANFRAEATSDELAEALSRTPAAYYVEATSPPPPTPPPQTAAAAATATAAAADASPVEVVGRELYFSAAQLDEIKRRATPADGSGGWVSTFEALSAFLWQSVYRARCGADRRRGAADTAALPVTDYLTSLNVRERFLASPADADTYFPVGCLTPTTTVSPLLLQDGPLDQVAAVLHALLRAPDLSSSEVQHTVRWLAAQPDRTRVRSRFSAGGFMLSAWNKFDVYGGAVFDAAPPVLVSTPFTCISLVDGLGYILPRPPPLRAAAAVQTSDPDPGGVVVYLALAAELWDGVASDALLGPYLA